MKAWSVARWPLVCIFLHVAVAMSADFSVTTPGGAFAYTFADGLGNGLGNNPTLTLERGKTYTFAINASSIHPFRINSAGAVNNNISSGTITYTVPMAVSNYIYECSIHHFFGTINTIAPVGPPTVRILGLSVGSTTVMLKSTGTNGWSVVPEFSTNLVTTNWSALLVQTNVFANGTNDTICGKPPADNVFIRVKNQKP